MLTEQPLMGFMVNCAAPTSTGEANGVHAIYNSNNKGNLKKYDQ